MPTQITKDKWASKLTSAVTDDFVTLLKAHGVDVLKKDQGDAIKKILKTSANGELLHGVIALLNKHGIGLEVTHDKSGKTAIHTSLYSSAETLPDNSSVVTKLRGTALPARGKPESIDKSTVQPAGEKPRQSHVDPEYPNMQPDEESDDGYGSAQSDGTKGNIVMSASRKPGRPKKEPSEQATALPAGAGADLVDDLVKRVKKEKDDLSEEQKKTIKEAKKLAQKKKDDEKGKTENPDGSNISHAPNKKDTDTTPHPSKQEEEGLPPDAPLDEHTNAAETAEATDPDKQNMKEYLNRDNIVTNKQHQHTGLNHNVNHRIPPVPIRHVLDKLRVTGKRMPQPNGCPEIPNLELFRKFDPFSHLANKNF
jgi:hypothetical protein